jgi:hypothetical protein
VRGQDKRRVRHLERVLVDLLDLRPHLVSREGNAVGPLDPLAEVDGELRVVRVDVDALRNVGDDGGAFGLEPEEWRLGERQVPSAAGAVALRQVQVSAVPADLLHDLHVKHRRSVPLASALSGPGSLGACHGRRRGEGENDDRQFSMHLAMIKGAINEISSVK